MENIICQPVPSLKKKRPATGELNPPAHLTFEPVEVGSEVLPVTITMSEKEPDEVEFCHEAALPPVAVNTCPDDGVPVTFTPLMVENESKGRTVRFG